MQIGDSGRIPNFIKAKTPQALRRLMLKNNAKKNSMFDYYQVIWTGKEWVAWYYDNSDLLDEINFNKRGKK